jgi:hypothetical protein
MPATTSPLGLPYPEPTDAPNGAAQIQALAQAVDAHMVATAPVRRVYTAGATWTKPAASTGFLGVIVELQGGGGGSGGCATTAASQTSGSGGGKGGGYAQFWVPAASLGATVAVTVGAGGTAGAAGANSGGDGGTSSFAAHGSVPGGAAGSGGGAAASSGATTSQSGGGTTQTFTGTATPVVFVSGSDGGTGYRINASAAAIPGYGGGSRLGGQQKTGAISSGQIAASVGQSYGGGASGPANMLAAGNTQQAGAAGAPGIVIVTEYYG